MIFNWLVLSKKDKKTILKMMSQDDINHIKNLVDMFDGIVITVEIIKNE